MHADHDDQPAVTTWPAAVVAIFRIAAGNAAVVALVYGNFLSGYAALSALGLGAVPGLVRLVRAAVGRRQSKALPAPAQGDEKAS